MPRSLGRTLLASLLALLLLLPFAVSSADERPAEKKERPQEKARIGTWNIEWLGNKEKRRKPAQEAKDIADYIGASKVGLLALNEITGNIETDGQLTSQTLTAAFKLLKEQNKGDWQHLLFPSEEK